MDRRTFLKVSGATVSTAMVGVSAPAIAQQYPTRDIHFVCAFPGGSSSDAIVRFVAEKIRPLTGQNLIVENKFGASGNIAAQYMLQSKPDGHTIFVHAGSAMAANMHIFKKPPFDAAKDIRVAGTIHRQAFMVGVDAKKPWKSLDELTAFLKEKGDKATYASYSTTGTVMGEIYKQTKGLQAVEVTYRIGADSLNDLASGAVDYGMYDPVFAMAQAREGRMRILGLSSDKRMQAAADIPTMTELGVTMDLTGWFGAIVPIATPQPIVDQINSWFRKVIATDEAKTFLNRFGGDPWVATPDEAQAQLLKDIKDWGEYVRLAKIKQQG